MHGQYVGTKKGKISKKTGKDSTKVVLYPEGNKCTVNMSEQRRVR